MAATKTDSRSQTARARARQAMADELERARKRESKLVVVFSAIDARADAEAALAWITGDENASPKSDYIHSIRVLALRGWVTWKDFGFACSILTTWRLAVERLDEVNRREEARRTAAADSDYVGTVGERRPFDLRVNSIKELPSDWGVTVLHLMEDREGNRFKWWASDKRLDPNESGEYLNVKGTIKAHDEYNGVKETVINRVVGA